MSFLESIKTCYEKSFTIRGRATRAEYWWFVLYNDLLIILTIVIANTKASVISIPLIALIVFSFIPSFTAQIRRLHDTDHSGFHILLACLLAFIPYIGCIGSIYLLVLECQKSDFLENDYGPCPLDAHLPSNCAEEEALSSSQTSVSNSQEIISQTNSCETEEKLNEEIQTLAHDVKIPDESKDWEEI